MPPETADLVQEQHPSVPKAEGKQEFEWEEVAVTGTEPVNPLVAKEVAQETAIQDLKKELRDAEPSDVLPILLDARTNGLPIEARTFRVALQRLRAGKRIDDAIQLIPVMLLEGVEPRDDVTTMVIHVCQSAGNWRESYFVTNLIAELRHMRDIFLGEQKFTQDAYDEDAEFTMEGLAYVVTDLLQATGRQTAPLIPEQEEMFGIMDTKEATLETTAAPAQ